MNIALVALLVSAAQQAGDPSDRIRAGNDDLDRGRLAEAEQRFLRAIADYPGFAPAYQGLGITLLRQGRTAPARDSLLRALEISPDLPKTRFLLGMAYFGLGQPEMAAAEFRRDLERRPTEKQAWLFLARSLLQLGRRDQALEALSQAQKLAPDDPDLLWLLAENDPGQREAAARRLVEAFPDSYQAQHWLAEEHRSKAEWALAAAHYRQAIAKASDVAGLHFGLARVLADMADYDGAARALNSELRIHPNSGPAHRLYSFLSLINGAFDEAAAHAETALRTGDRPAESHFLLGRALASSGNLAAAARELEQALLLDPGMRDAHFKLAEVYSQLGKAIEAREHLNAFRRLAGR